jgi:hypothetical protein
VQAAKQRAAAAEVDARLDEIGGQLRLAMFERVRDGLEDLADRLAKGPADFWLDDGSRAGR